MPFTAAGRRRETTLVEKVCIMSAVSEGYSLKEIAATYGVAKSTASRIRKEWLADRKLHPLPRKGRPPKLTKADINKIVIYSDENCNGGLMSAVL